MTLFSQSQLADTYLLMDSEDVTYRDRQSATPNFSTGQNVEVFTDSTVTVIREDLTEVPEATRKLLEGDRAYTCLYGDDAEIGGTTIYALGVIPAHGDRITDGSEVYAVVSWIFLNDNQQVRLICRRLP